jgi:hypothetical protein
LGKRKTPPFTFPVRDLESCKFLPNENNGIWNCRATGEGVMMKRTAIDDDGGGDEDEMKREMNLRKRRTREKREEGKTMYLVFWVCT